MHIISVCVFRSWFLPRSVQDYAKVSRVFSPDPDRASPLPGPRSGPYDRHCPGPISPGTSYRRNGSPLCFWWVSLSVLININPQV